MAIVSSRAAAGLFLAAVHAVGARVGTIDAAERSARDSGGASPTAPGIASERSPTHSHRTLTSHPADTPAGLPAQASAHPDRLATTLAQRERLLAEGPPVPVDTPAPGSGSHDARLPLKQLFRRAEREVAATGDAAARALLARVLSPDLRAGTVQDGVARGIQVALEEALSLCAPVATVAEKPSSHVDRIDAEPRLDRLEVIEGKDLRRRRELVVASGGARLRWSRRAGILFVDRDHEVHAEDCVRFEDRRDLGTLDDFVAAPDERPRLFSPAFLKPVRYTTGDAGQSLLLEGRLGRRSDGYPCRLQIDGRPGETTLHLRLAIRNDHDDHRLRLRLLGCWNPEALQLDVDHPPTPELRRGNRFLAATIVRSCGRLQVGPECVEVPQAQCKGWIERDLRLGGAAWTRMSKE